MPRMQVNSQEQTIVEQARLIEKLIAKREKLEHELVEIRQEIEIASAQMRELLPVRIAATSAPPMMDEQPGVTDLLAGARG